MKQKVKIRFQLGLSWWQYIKYKLSKEYRDKINKEFNLIE